MENQAPGHPDLHSQDSVNKKLSILATFEDFKVGYDTIWRYIHALMKIHIKVKVDKENKRSGYKQAKNALS